MGLYSWITSTWWNGHLGCKKSNSKMSLKFCIIMESNSLLFFPPIWPPWSLVRAINHQEAYSITTSTRTRTPEICIFNEQTQKYLHALHLPFLLLPFPRRSGGCRERSCLKNFKSELLVTFRNKNNLKLAYLRWRQTTWALQKKSFVRQDIYFDSAATYPVIALFANVEQ